MTNFKSECTAFSRPIDAGQLLRQGTGGRPDQAMDSAWLVSLRVPQAPRSNTDPHVVAECPQPLACLHVPWRKLVWARPDDDFPRGCSGQRAELPSRRCGSRSRVGPKHFRCPRQRSSTVSVRPTHLPDTAAEGHGPSSGFSMRPQRRTYSKSFKAQVIQECSEPGASIANIALGYSLNANLVHKWIRLLTQKTTAIQPAFIPLPSQMLGAGSHAQARCCDHEFDPVGP